MKLMKLPDIIRIQFLAILVFGTTAASATTLLFDELPSQPVDGLSISGVTFGFEVGGSPSSDATYNVDLGIGPTAYLSDPVLEGDATGLLTLLFAAPTPQLSFGLGLLAGTDFMPGALVSLYDNSNALLDSIGINTLANMGISEGLFDYANPLGVSKAVIDFDDTAGRFALDNLTFGATAASPVPEGGSTLVHLGAALFGLAVLRAAYRGNRAVSYAGTK